MGKFPLGALVMTRAFEEKLFADSLSPQDAAQTLAGCLRRYASGDWGEVDDHDKQANDSALRNGNRLMGVYYLPRTGVRFYLITESDRSVTTFLLPEDY